MTTETVILIAIFAGLAIAAGAIIVAKATIFIYQQRFRARAASELPQNPWRPQAHLGPTPPLRAPPFVVPQTG
jgi:hypothetical protein